jgi:hypothetical protein
LRGPVEIAGRIKNESAVGANAIAAGEAVEYLIGLGEGIELKTK